MFQKISGIEKFYASERGLSRFSVENFLSHSTKKIRWGTLRCIRKFRASQNFMHQRGGITFLPRKLFVTQYQKNSLGNTSVFQKISGIEKFYASERGLSRFAVENFLSHSTEKFRWGTLGCIRKFRASQNYMLKKGISLNTIEKFLSHSADKIRRRTLLWFERILVSKIFMHRRGASRFCRNFLSHRTETKSFVKEPFCFPENFWYRKKFMDKRGHITFFRRKFFVSQCRKNS